MNDCISRAEALKHSYIVYDDELERHNVVSVEDIEELPTVNQPKTVIYSGDGYADGSIVYDMAECPNCGYEYDDSDKEWGLPFCPCCGQSLIWESEDI